MASVRGAITCLLIALLSPKEGKAEQLSKGTFTFSISALLLNFPFLGVTN